MQDTLTSFEKTFAKRVLPARPDLAAEHLRGKVSAHQFVTGTRRSVIAPLLDLSVSADPGASLDTQLLHGETFVVYETRKDGLAWGQAELDGYVGYVRSEGLGVPRPKGVRVTAIWSQAYPKPDVRSRPLHELPFMAEVAVAGTSGAYARLRNGGHVPRPHLEAIQHDPVHQAKRFVGVPYLWGGRSARGIDCSALVQLSFLAVGQVVPRDSDMQAASLGAPLPKDAPALRGDLIFWKGHVGMLLDSVTLVHANGYHMAVVVEPFAPAVERIAAQGGGPIIARHRPEFRRSA